MSAAGGIATLLAACAVGLCCWDTIRQAGAQLEDRDVVEAAPVFSGVVIAVAYTVVALGLSGALAGDVRATPDSLLMFVGENAILYGAATTIFLLSVEAVLWDEGRLPDHEWRLVGGFSGVLPFDD